MPSSPVCIDANLVVYYVTSLEGDAAAVAVRERWREWDRDNRRMVAPRLMTYEVTNALHRLAASRAVSTGAARQSLDAALSLPIEFFHDEDLHERAMDLASRFHRPAAYDAHYLALADRLGAEFWTADKRLANAVRPHLGWVRLLGE